MLMFSHHKLKRQAKVSPVEMQQVSPLEITQRVVVVYSTCTNIDCSSHGLFVAVKSNPFYNCGYITTYLFITSDDM